MCGRPLGFKGFEENSDAWVDCDHVFGLLTRHHDRWPRWNPRSGPKQSSGLRATGFNGLSGSSIRPIVISVSSFTPASTRGSGGDRLWPITPPRVLVTLAGLAGRAIWLVNHGRNPAAVQSSEAPRDRARQSPVTPRPWRHLADSGSASSHVAYSAWRFASAAIVSFQRWIRLRRSAGRRMRTTGAPSARAAG